MNVQSLFDQLTSIVSTWGLTALAVLVLVVIVFKAVQCLSRLDTFDWAHPFSHNEVTLGIQRRLKSAEIARDAQKRVFDSASNRQRQTQSALETAEQRLADENAKMVPDAAVVTRLEAARDAAELARDAADLAFNAAETRLETMQTAVDALDGDLRERQPVSAIILLGIAIAIVLGLIWWLGHRNSEGGVTVGEARVGMLEMVQKAEAVDAPGYGIDRNGDRFDLQIPFGGLEDEFKKTLKEAVDAANTSWNTSNATRQRTIEGYLTCNIVGYTSTGKLVGISVWCQGKQAGKDAKFQYLDPSGYGKKNPGQVLAIVQSARDKLDLLNTGNGGSGGRVGIGNMQLR